MANTVVVLSASANVSKESLVTSKHSKSIDRAKQTKSSVDKKTKLATPGVDSFREKLSTERLSEVCRPYWKCQGQSLITNRPGVSGMAGVLEERLIPLDVLRRMWCNF